MLPDAYVRSILAKYELPSGEGSPAELAAAELRQPITEWAGRFLLDIRLCGSYAKETRIRGTTDIDLLISLGPRTPLGIDKLYDRFFDFMKRRGYNPRRQSVTVGVTHHGLMVDLIPAKQEWGGANDHLIFETEHQRITRTNFDTHLQAVKESGTIEEIRLLKIWRTLRGLRLPSLCLELAVMDALRRQARHQPAANTEVVLRYLKDVLPSAPIRDPANFENLVSDDLLKHEKLAISEAAAESLKHSDWAKIVW